MSFGRFKPPGLPLEPEGAFLANNGGKRKDSGGSDLYGSDLRDGDFKKVKDGRSLSYYWSASTIVGQYIIAYSRQWQQKYWS